MPRINRKTKKIEEIIQDYIDYCNYKNLRPKTIKSYYQTLMLFARYLEEEMGITGEQLIDHEYEKFIKAIDLTKFHEYRDYVIINLIFDTGMRLSEILAIKVICDLNTQNLITMNEDNQSILKDKLALWNQTSAGILANSLIIGNAYIDASGQISDASGTIIDSLGQIEDFNIMF